MAERNYYVLCDDNCRFEGMTKEQIYDAIAEATGHTPTPVDEAFITMIKEQNRNNNTKIWTGTAAQYNALATKDSNTLYFVNTNKIEAVDLPDVWPISKGGTGATTAENARSNLGLSGAETKTLLWTNATLITGISFNPQTLSLNLTNYSAVTVEFAHDDHDNQRNIVTALKNKTAMLFAPNSIVSGSVYVSYRSFQATNSGVEFLEGHAGNNSTNNYYAIPTKIYGIKEV